MKCLKKSNQVGIIAFLLLLLVLLASLVFTDDTTPTPVYAAHTGNTTSSLRPLSMVPQYETVSCDSPKAKTRCVDGNVCSTQSIDQEGVCAVFGGPLESLEEDAMDPLLAQALSIKDLGFGNLVANGTLDSGFYQVPELGFEAPDIGNVPHNWGWYKGPAYGKYNIYNNERLGIVCLDDLISIREAYEKEQAAQEGKEEGLIIVGTEHSLGGLGTTPEEVEFDPNMPFGPIPGYSAPVSNNALALHMQSTDQNDARLGVYQTVNVVPGQDYRFSMSATIQVQAEARTATVIGPDGEPIPQAPNHTYELYFDHTGGTDWRAIPHEKWINVPIQEEKLFFTVEETEKKGESALAEIQDYETIVTARSNRMTIFITAWRKWANWRTAIFTVDCISLSPLDPAGIPGSAAAAAAPLPVSTPSVEVEAVSITKPAETQVEPAPAQTQPETAPAETQTETEPIQTQPETAPTETEPAQTQPETAPAEIQAETEPAQTQPETAPTETEVETTPAEQPSSIIPASGGVLDNAGNSILIAIVSLVVILGLVGAGIWNMRRSRK